MQFNINHTIFDCGTNSMFAAASSTLNPQWLHVPVVNTPQNACLKTGEYHNRAHPLPSNASQISMNVSYKQARPQLSHLSHAVDVAAVATAGNLNRNLRSVSDMRGVCYPQNVSLQPPPMLMQFAPSSNAVLDQNQNHNQANALCAQQNLPQLPTLPRQQSHQPLYQQPARLPLPLAHNAAAMRSVSHSLPYQHCLISRPSQTLPRHPRFVALKSIGSGTFAEIWEVYDRYDAKQTHYALKTLKMDKCVGNNGKIDIHKFSKYTNAMVSEGQRIMKLNKLNKSGAAQIVQCHHVLVPERLNRSRRVPPHLQAQYANDQIMQQLVHSECGPSVVLELMGVSLLQYVQLFEHCQRTISLATARFIATQLFNALSFLHGVGGYIHADLKPENILLSLSHSMPSHLLSNAYPDIKLVDLGNALSYDRDINTFEVQSLYYRAPEVVFGKEITSAIDLWSIGCILFEFIRIIDCGGGSSSSNHHHSTTTTNTISSSKPRRHHALFACCNRTGLIARINRILSPFPKYAYNRHSSCYYAQIRNSFKPVVSAIVPTVNVVPVQAQHGNQAWKGQGVLDSTSGKAHHDEEEDDDDDDDDEHDGDGEDERIHDGSDDDEEADDDEDNGQDEDEGHEDNHNHDHDEDEDENRVIHVSIADEDDDCEYISYTHHRMRLFHNNACYLQLKHERKQALLMRLAQANPTRYRQLQEAQEFNDFVDLIACLLDLNSWTRYSSEDAMQHSFILNMRYIANDRHVVTLLSHKTESVYPSVSILTDQDRQGVIDQQYLHLQQIQKRQQVVTAPRESTVTRKHAWSDYANHIPRILHSKLVCLFRGCCNGITHSRQNSAYAHNDENQPPTFMYNESLVMDPPAKKSKYS